MKKQLEDALGTVLENTPEDWKKRYSVKVPEFLKTHPLFLGEDVTKWMREQGVGEPNHENAWGAMFNSAIASSGFVIRTGLTKNATSGKSNGHAFRLWRSLLAMDEGEIINLNSQILQLAAKVRTRKIDVLTALKLAVEVGVLSVTSK